VEEFYPLPAGATVDLSTGDVGRVWSERVHLTGAQSVSAHVGGVLDALPAVTRHRYGAGTAWYVSTQLDEDAYARLLADPVEEAAVRPVHIGLPAGVEVVHRTGGRVSWLFALNHTDQPQEVPADGVDLMHEKEVPGSLHLPPGGVAVIRTAAAAGPPRR
jgi:beta-galactosidase